jgi:hypothetical protein
MPIQTPSTKPSASPRRGDAPRPDGADLRRRRRHQTPRPAREFGPQRVFATRRWPRASSPVRPRVPPPWAATGDRPAVRALPDATRWTRWSTAPASCASCPAASFPFPLVTLAMTGAGWGVGAQHNHNRGLVRAQPGPQGGDAVERRRLQGPAEERHPRRQPGAVLHRSGAASPARRGARGRASACPRHGGDAS